MRVWWCCCKSVWIDGNSFCVCVPRRDIVVICVWRNVHQFEDEVVVSKVDAGFRVPRMRRGILRCRWVDVWLHSEQILRSRVPARITLWEIAGQMGNLRNCLSPIPVHLRTLISDLAVTLIRIILEITGPPDPCSHLFRHQLWIWAAVIVTFDSILLYKFYNYSPSQLQFICKLTSLNE